LPRKSWNISLMPNKTKTTGHHPWTKPKYLTPIW
jgi:hypothetical protein